MKQARQRRTTWTLTLINEDGTTETWRKPLRNLFIQGQYVAEPHWRKQDRPLKKRRRAKLKIRGDKRRERREDRRDIGPF